MDADFDPDLEGNDRVQETPIVAFRNRKDKNRSKFAEAVYANKPYHDPGTYVVVYIDYILNFGLIQGLISS